MPSLPLAGEGSCGGDCRLSPNDDVTEERFFSWMLAIAEAKLKL